MRAAAEAEMQMCSTLYIPRYSGGVFNFSFVALLLTKVVEESSLKLLELALLSTTDARWKLDECLKQGVLRKTWLDMACHGDNGLAASARSHPLFLSFNMPRAHR